MRVLSIRGARGCLWWCAHGPNARVVELRAAAEHARVPLPPGLPDDGTALAALPPVLDTPPAEARAGAHLVQRCGPGSGRRWPLWPGVWSLDRRGPQPHQGRGPAVRVDGPGRFHCTPGETPAWRVDGQPLTEPIPLHHGATIDDGARLWQVLLSEVAPPHRAPIEPPVQPEEPTPPSPPGPMSWAAVVLPLGGGVLAAVLFGPLMAVMSAMAAVVAVGRHLEVRWRHRRAQSRHRALVADLHEAHAARLRGEAAAEHRRRWLQMGSGLFVGAGSDTWADGSLDGAPVVVAVPGAVIVEAPAAVARALARHLALQAAVATRRAVRGFDEPWEHWWHDDPDAIQVRCTEPGAHVQIGGAGELHLRWLGDGTARLPDGRVVVPPVVDADVADRAARDLSVEATRNGLPGAVALADLLGLPDPAAISRRWEGAHSLGSTWCVGAGGPIEIDLVRDGPHALVAGTTGSGKSELLRSWVLSMAASHDPSRLHLVLVDFKGGGAFDAVARLPHVAAVVTDLDDHLAERALVGLRAELTSREHRLRAAAVADLRDWPADAERAPARLVVVVDELATLVAELPAFVDGLVDIAQRGRSLGIHLVLATQRPAGVVTAAVRANVNLRVALRVQSAHDAVDVIDDLSAASLPAIPGRALVRIGGDPAMPVQSAWASGPWVEPTAVRLWPDGETPAPLPVLGRELDRWVEAIAEAAAGRFARPGAPWPPPLPERIVLTDLPAGSFALADHPDRQCQSPVRWDPAAGHLLVMGADGGRVVNSAVTAAAAVADPRSRVIGIDGGGGVLGRVLAGVPGVGMVASTGDDAAIGRALRVVSKTVHGADESWPGSTIVIVDQVVAVLEALDQLDRGMRSDLMDVLRRAVAGGVRVVLTASSPRGVPSAVSDLCGMRLVHQLADPSAALTAGLRADEAVWLRDARAVVLPARARVVVGCHGGSPVLGADGVPPIRVLGEWVDAEDLPSAECRSGGWWVPLGLDVDTEVIGVHLSAGSTLLVAGPPGAGVTNTVRVIAERARAVAPVVWVDRLSLPSDLDAIGAGTVVVVDDADLLAPAVGQALAARLWGERPDRPCAVIGGHIDGLRSLGHWTAPARAGRRALLLRPGPGDGDLIRSTLPTRSTDRWPHGRGLLTDGSGWRVVQVAACNGGEVPEG